MRVPTCSSGYATGCTLVQENGNVWLVTDLTCQAASECETPAQPPGESPPTPPCAPPVHSGGPGFGLTDCDGDDGDEWAFSLWVSARVPPHRVQVDPFPRWLVAMGAPLPAPYESGEPGRLTLQDYPAYTPPELCAPNGPGYEAGCWSEPAAWPQREPDEEPEPGDVRNFRVGLRWRRVRADQPNGNDLGPVPPTCWDFNERAWNVGQNYGYGPIPGMVCGSTNVTHIYETSSWGLPHNGPRFLPREEACNMMNYSERVNGCCEQVPSGDGEWDMAAYQVRVATTWAVEWAVKWEAWERVGTEWSECGCHAEWGGPPPGSVPHQDCTPPAGVCNQPGEWYGRIGEGAYTWVAHEEGWHPLDLRQFGNPTWYYTSWAVITTGEGPWCAYEYADPNPGDTVRVPVIEVQSVLRDPCVLTDSC